MATIQSTKSERRNYDEPTLVEKVPEADINGLRQLGDNAFYPRKFQYLSKSHTRADLLRPGYFSSDPLSRNCARDHMREGDEIHFTMCNGSGDVTTWERGIVCVVSNPTGGHSPLTLGVIVDYPQMQKADKIDDDDKAA